MLIDFVTDPESTVLKNSKGIDKFAVPEWTFRGPTALRGIDFIEARPRFRPAGWLESNMFFSVQSSSERSYGAENDSSCFQNLEARNWRVVMASTTTIFCLARRRYPDDWKSGYIAGVELPKTAPTFPLCDEL